MSFEAAAALLLPVDGDGVGRVAPAGARWSLDPADWRGASALVWGGEPSRAEARADAVRGAWRRERTLARLRLRPPGPLIVAGVHRWPWEFHRSRFLPVVARAVRAGLLVELRADRHGPRAIDAAAQAAGALRGVARLAFGEAGSASARIARAAGADVLLRAGITGTGSDAAHAVAGLERLALLGLPWVPKPEGNGHTGTVSWSAEQLLPGRPPQRLTPDLVADVCRVLLALPQAEGPPAAFSDDVEALCQALPELAQDLRGMLARHQAVLASLPCVMRHGDLWTGNLLAQDGRLTGVVDWDSWHPAAVPGADLLHLVAAERARTGHRTFAQELLERPWEAPAFQAGASGYWRALGVEAREPVLRAVGAAWWAGQAARHLARLPRRAHDEGWVATQVSPALGV
jgi:hypothetical protein